MQTHLVTLLDMIQTETWNLVNHASGLTRIRDDMKARYSAYCGHVDAGIEPAEHFGDGKHNASVAQDLRSHG